MPRWQQGDQISPRWEILKVLEGGMSDIYVVHDRELNYLLAAKTYKNAPTFYQNRQVAVLFEQEANAWVDLGLHENIAHAYFVHRIEQKPFIFIEYVDGGDLDSWIQRGPRSGDLRQVLRFAIQLCDGMVHAFANGLIAHRDLKPKNCLIGPDGTLKVTDFGLALAHNSLGQGAAGTRPYMAPEQWDGSTSVDQRTDIYAFGVTVYEMVTGQLPFVVPFTPGKPVEQMNLEYRALHKSAAPPPLACELPGLPEVVAKCLAKAPSDRFADFAEVRVEAVSLHRACAS
jgi:serine/threonine protein kinase